MSTICIHCDVWLVRRPDISQMKNQLRILFDPEKKEGPNVLCVTHINTQEHVPNLKTIYFTYKANRAKKTYSEINVGIGSVL